MTETKPEALRLAEMLEQADGVMTVGDDLAVAAELRRLYDLLGKANALARIRAEKLAAQQAVMQQALKALEWEWEWGGEPQGTLTWGAITALREQLEGKQ